MWWTAQKSQKYRLPHLPNVISPVKSMRCAKTIWRPRLVSYRKSLLTSHSVMEMCFSCFINAKYNFLRCKLPIGGFHAVSGDINNNGEINKCWWTNKTS